MFNKCDSCGEMRAASVDTPTRQPQPRRATVRESDRGKASGIETLGGIFDSGLKLLTTVLWVGGGLLAFGAGEVLLGLIAVAYLTYLWVFGGRWLIY